MVAVSDENTGPAVGVVPGPAGDAPLLVPILDRARDRAPDIAEVVGDKAFDGDALRGACPDREVNPNITLRANRNPELWAFDPASYKERNRVERPFAEAKQFRRIATRYEKLEVTYFGLLHLTLGFIRLRSRNTVNTT